MRLLNRTTRRIHPHRGAGLGFYDDVVSLLNAIEEAESAVMGRARQGGGGCCASLRRRSSRGSTSRRRLGPLLDAHPALRLALDLNDGYSDIGGGNIDVAIRIMVPENSSLIVRKLAPNRRFFVATPQYLAERGTPQTLEDLGAHRPAQRIEPGPLAAGGARGRLHDAPPAA
ncbi:MAG: LysR substrate-binding domain-containing protein [Sphingomonas sp.]